MKKFFAFLMAMAMLLTCAAAVAESTTAVTLDVMQDYRADDPILAQYGEPAPAGQEDLPVILIKHKKHMKLNVTTQPSTVKSAKISAYSEDNKIVSVIGTTITGEKVGQTVVHLIREKEPKAELAVRVIVYMPVRKVTIKAPVKHVEPTESIQLTAQVAPGSANVQTVTWYSSNENIATVDATGKVTGVKRGAVRISAVADDGSFARGSVRIQVTRAMGVGDLIEDQFAAEPEEVQDVLPVDGSDENYYARLDEYDPTDNTVLVSIMDRITIDKEEAESLKVGSNIQIGDETVTVETLQADKFSICINEMYYLDYTDEGGELTASFMSMPLYETVVSGIMEVADDLVFVDGIDPETGTPLDEPVTRTAAEFKEMIQDLDDIGFNADNVYIRFDEDTGVLKRVERYYTPFQ